MKYFLDKCEKVMSSGGLNSDDKFNLSILIYDLKSVLEGYKYNGFVWSDKCALFIAFIVRSHMYMFDLVEHSSARTELLQLVGGISVRTRW